MSEVKGIRIEMEKSEFNNYLNNNSYTKGNSTTNYQNNNVKVEQVDLNNQGFSGALNTIVNDVVSIFLPKEITEDDVDLYKKVVSGKITSLKREDFKTFIRCYKSDLNNNIKAYEDMLESVNSELSKYEEINKKIDAFEKELASLGLTIETLNDPKMEANIKGMETQFRGIYQRYQNLKSSMSSINDYIKTETEFKCLINNQQVL